MTMIVAAVLAIAAIAVLVGLILAEDLRDLDSMADFDDQQAARSRACQNQPSNPGVFYNSECGDCGQTYSRCRCSKFDSTARFGYREERDPS